MLGPTPEILIQMHWTVARARGVKGSSWDSSVPTGEQPVWSVQLLCSLAETVELSAQRQRLSGSAVCKNGRPRLLAAGPGQAFAYLQVSRGLLSHRKV